MLDLHPCMGKHLISSDFKQKNKLFHLSISEVMTIVIAFHQSGYQDLKTYYIHFICHYFTNKFPELTSNLHKYLLMQICG
ncbi:hypothetical protein [Candidatus Enterovibrio escicola]